MEVFFTSDLHFGHTNIIKYCNRPYATVEEMDEALIDNWNAVVRPQDRVWLLGDFVMGRIKESLPTAYRLNGEKHLVPGNHDRCWSGNGKVGNWPARYEEVGFILEPNEIQLVLADRYVNVCHFPYIEDERHKDRYSEHRPKDDGRVLLHGHIHDMWKTNERQINVGIDVWDYAPVPLDTIVALVTKLAA